MSVEFLGIIGIFALLIFLFGGMWLGFAMAFVGFCGLVLVMGFESATMIMATIPYTTLAYYPISAPTPLRFDGCGSGVIRYRKRFVSHGPQVVWSPSRGLGRCHHLCFGRVRRHYRQQFGGAGDIGIGRHSRNEKIQIQ